MGKVSVLVLFLLLEQRHFQSVTSLSVPTSSCRRTYSLARTNSYSKPTAYASAQGQPPICSSTRSQSWSSRRNMQQTQLSVSQLSATDTIIAGTSMAVLALQSGAMPTLQKKCVPKDICRSSVVIAQEATKFGISAFCLLCLTDPMRRQSDLVHWSVKTWWQLAGVPAALYSVQNFAKLMAVQHLPAVTYNVLNQTKTLSTAVFCYFLLGQKQSPLQISALALLITSALVIEGVVNIDYSATKVWQKMRDLPRLSVLKWGQSRHSISSKRSLFSVTMATNNHEADVSKEENPPSKTRKSPEDKPEKPKNQVGRDRYHLTRGVLPLMIANLVSGLAAAVVQSALQHHKRNLYLYGMELSSASILMVVLSLFWSNDGQKLRKEGISRHWKSSTWIPIGAYGIGGTLNGVVTKYAGSVEKGLSSILGVFLSGLLQKWYSQEELSKNHVIGGLLACISVWMYVSFPVKN